MAVERKRKEDSTFLALLKAGAAPDPWLDLSVLEPASEGCFCWLLFPWRPAETREAKDCQRRRLLN